MDLEEFIQRYQANNPEIFDNSTQGDLRGLYNLARTLFPDEMRGVMDGEICEKLAKLVYGAYGQGEVRGLVRGVSPKE